MKVFGRYRQRWCVVGVVMTVFITCTIYMATHAVFDADVDLTPPRSVHGPIYPWDKHYRGPLANYDGDPSKEKAEDIIANGVKVQVEAKKEDKAAPKPDKKVPVDFVSEQKAVQLSRHKQLEDTCKKYPQLHIGAINVDTQRHILVNEKHKLLYCFVPKVGCSNWKRVLMKLVGKSNKPLAEITSDEAHYKHGMRRLQAYKPEDQKKMLETYTKFVYARNPFVRILSAYKNKYGDVVMYRKETYFHQFAKKMIKKYRENPSQRALETGENATWTEFVKYLTDPAKNYFDDHWEEMFKLCSPCKIKYDYIGHLETIGADAKYMLDTLGLSSQVEYPSPKTSHPTNSTSTFENSFSELTIAQLKGLWQIYQKDFELFGYEKPDFLPSTV
ncbi:carbohydrate sulfotransferase 11-like [Apostichopus japonicus]|uniref:carbohydrate sulfotransferase 11-like n=1 Tax=Stichopus japonicus TaxID=307972 RepID=UPI003AB5593F